MNDIPFLPQSEGRRGHTRFSYTLASHVWNFSIAWTSASTICVGGFHLIPVASSSGTILVKDGSLSMALGTAS